MPRIQLIDDRNIRLARHNQPRLARGFTLVELLVVIAIIGVLVALLLPAVQAAREAARRMQCASNTKQLAIAVLNYESAHKSLPPAGKYLDAGAPHEDVNLRGGPNHSWIVLVLPQMEQQPVYDQFNLKSVRIDDAPGNPQPQQTQIASLQCASDQAQGREYKHWRPGNAPDTGQRSRFAKGNYAAFNSVHHADFYRWPGAISLYGQELREIEDGTTSTLLLSEVRTRDAEFDQRGVWALPWAGSSLVAYDMHAIGPNGQESRISTDTGFEYIPDPNWIGLSRKPNSSNPDASYDCGELTDQAAALAEGLPCEAGGFLSAAPRSNHPGGVNAALVDGSVFFLKDNIDDFVMAYLVYVRDQQIVDASSL